MRIVHFMKVITFYYILCGNKHDLLDLNVLRTINIIYYCLRTEADMGNPTV